MHDRDNEDVIVLDGVEHGVRENANQAAADIIFKYPPTVGCGNDSADRQPNFARKTLTEISPALFVKLDSLLELHTRFRMEFVPHFASKRSMRR
jgi:hypothetical protein